MYTQDVNDVLMMSGNISTNYVNMDTLTDRLTTRDKQTGRKI